MPYNRILTNKCRRNDNKCRRNLALIAEIIHSGKKHQWIQKLVSESK